MSGISSECNAVVEQHVSLEDIQSKMLAWVKRMREGEDFRVQLVKDELDSKCMQAVEYALKFADACGLRGRFEAIDEWRSRVDLGSCVNALELEKKEVFFKVIVPNYNNMPYLKKCLDSILEQTFQDFIVVIVDDLSTDSSDQLCAAYARQHPGKIVYMQLKQKGYAGAARNVGLSYSARSEYVQFLDADDHFYDAHALERMHAKICDDKNPLIVFCSYGQLDSNGRLCRRIASQRVKNICYDGPAPWKYCIKNDLSSIKFKEGRCICNDVVWFLRILNALSSQECISTLDDICVFYNKESTTSCWAKNSSALKDDAYNSMKQLIEVDLPAEPSANDMARKFKQYQMRTIAGILKSRPRKAQQCLDVHRANAEKTATAMTSQPECADACMVDSLKNSFTISINKDLYLLQTKLFAKAGLTPMPRLMFGCTNDSISLVRRCAYAHASVIQMAKQLDLPFVIVFEDDAYPCIGCAEKLQHAIASSPADMQMLLLGWSSHIGKRQSFNKKFNRVQTWTISGSHAYMLKKSAYSCYLDFIKKSQAKADNQIFQAIPGSYILDKPLFIQYSPRNSQVNSHRGYIFYGDHPSPPPGFLKIEDMLKP